MQQNIVMRKIFCKNMNCSLCTKLEGFWRYSISSDVTFMKIKSQAVENCAFFHLFWRSDKNPYKVALATVQHIQKQVT